MTATNVTAPPKSSAVFYGTAANGCLAYATLALLLMHVFRPDLAPASHMISEYAVGSYGLVMQTVFVGLSAGCAMLLVGLVRNGPTSIAARVGQQIFYCCAPCMVVRDLESAADPGPPLSVRKFVIVICCPEIPVHSEFSSERPNNSFKPTPLRGAA